MNRRNISDLDIKQEYGITVKRKDNCFNSEAEKKQFDRIYGECPHSVDTCSFVKADNGVVYIEFREFMRKAKNVMQSFSTRLGGVSSGIYESMNLCGWQQDEADNVFENYRRFAEVMEVSVDDYVCSQQTHTANCMRADVSHKGMGVTRQRSYSDVDALICNENKECLVTYYADCTPVIVADTKCRGIGAAHAGWRGTVSDIASVMTAEMRKEYMISPSELVAVIGPCICKDCYEVSNDVAEQFMSKYNKMEQSFIIKKGKKEGKYQLNLVNANVINLINAGLAPSNIYVSDICTCCNSRLLFSHRASAGKRGLMADFICKKGEDK